MSPPGRKGFVRRAAAAIVLASALAAVATVPFPVVETGIGERWRGPATSLEASIAWPEREEFPIVRAEPTPRGDSFRVRVWDEQGRQLFERHQSARQPLSIVLDLTGVSPGRSLLWQLDVLDEGQVISSSGPRRLTWSRR